MSELSRVTAIVVVWNGGDEAVEALRSLVEQEAGEGRELTVVAVDNGSTDDTVARIRAALPAVEVLELGDNLGYGAAANRAMAAHPADAYLVLNQDAEYRPGFVAALADALAADSSLGAATAQVRLAGRFVHVDPATSPGGSPADSPTEEARSAISKPAPESPAEEARSAISKPPADTTLEKRFIAHDGTAWRRTLPGEDGVELLNSTGNQVTRSGNGLDRGWLQPVDTEYPRAVLGFHGGACALRASAVEPLGGFDEAYFMYYEDTDLSLRLRRAGWSIEYVPEAVSVHAHASSSDSTSPRFVEWNARNRAWNARRHGPLRMRAVAGVRTAAGAAKGALAAANPRAGADTRALGRARLRGALAGLGPLPKDDSKSAVSSREAASRTAKGGVAGGGLETGLRPYATRGETHDGAAPRTLVDLTSVPPKLGGVGRYLEGLVRGLESLGASPVLVARPEHVEHFRALAPHAELHAAPAAIGKRGLRFGWEQSGLLRLANELRAEAIHSPHYTFPRGTPLPRIVTLHDATFFSDPQAHSRVKRVFFQRWIRTAMRANVTIIAPSRATASELVKHAGTPKRPIVVAHHGVDREVFREPGERELAEFRADHGLGDREWFAFLGTIEPRKQLAQLIRAHRLLRERDPEAPLLLVSGQRGWDEEAIALLDEEAARRDPVVRELGYLPLEQLRALLGGSVAFCYPSIAEGFGLPVLEAMASGAPVVTTHATALPEVGGDAVVYAEPTPSALAEALGALAADPAERARLRDAGLARAAEFTWERCARLHLEAYSRAAAKRR